MRPRDRPGPIRRGGSPVPPDEAQPRWAEARAEEWYAQQPWLVGACYIPAYAVNELEMWQPSTFDGSRIDTELAWAQDLGYNTVRVFLHDLLWEPDPEEFLDRVHRFLSIADSHALRTLFVLFDSCWDPQPNPGPQLDPRAGVCMSRWVQSPGTRALEDPTEHRRLEEYVRGVVRRFATDERVLGWDAWNEPDHLPDHQTGPAFAANESPRKVDLVTDLLPRVFGWIRGSGARQPVTCGVWNGTWTSTETLRPIERVQMELSDVVSFHSYDPPSEFESKVIALKAFHRPVWCTEYLARSRGSNFRGTLPIARENHVAALNWGFVAGRTQGFLPWDSWERPYPGAEPKIWFHDVLRRNGDPYDAAEVAFIRTMTRNARPGTRPAAAAAQVSGRPVRAVDGERSIVLGRSDGGSA
jgi:hypothetical protein